MFTIGNTSLMIQYLRMFLFGLNLISRIHVILEMLSVLHGINISTYKKKPKESHRKNSFSFNKQFYIKKG